MSEKSPLLLNVRPFRTISIPAVGFFRLKFSHVTENRKREACKVTTSTTSITDRGDKLNDREAGHTVVIYISQIANEPRPANESENKEKRRMYIIWPKNFRYESMMHVSGADGEPQQR